jgi:hypothetical protein
MYRVRFSLSIVYQVARSVHHQWLRLSLGAFRTSPVEFVCWSKRAFPWKQTYQIWNAVCNEIESLSSNPAYDFVFNPLFENVYDKQPNTIQPFGLRIKSHFENSDINLDDIAPIVIPENPPWLNPKPIFNFELTQYKKSETNLLLI